MKIPAFIKQLAKCCDPEQARYALGCIKCVSDGKTASMTATDGRILASVHWKDDDGIALDSLADAKELSSPPVKAFSHPLGVRFDGDEFRGGVSGSVTLNTSGRFPDYEKVMTIHASPKGYVSVNLDASLLGKLCALSHAMNDDRYKHKGITLFVKDSQSCVFASTLGEDGHVARFAIMPLAADDEAAPTFPPRPGAVQAAKGEPATRSRRKATQPAPVPELMDDEQVAVAVTEPDDWSVCLPPIC
jgi:hypothetical protein